MITGAKHNLSERLLRYSATASLVASGVMAASSLPVTAASVITWEGSETAGPGDTLYINLDQEGDNEFQITVTAFFTTYSVTSARIFASYFGTDVRVLGTSGGYFYPAALPAGYVISASPAITAPQQWLTVTRPASLTYSDYWGQWTSMNDETAYLGLRFTADTVPNEEHFAWVELTVTSMDYGGPIVEMTRIGMGDVAGESIPASVDVASVGAAGGLQTLVAAAFAAVGGALTWIRRKLSK